MTNPACKQIRIPNETSYLAAVREAVREVVVGSEFPDEELNRLTLAVDESVTNVMEHAYENDLEGEMFIEVALEASDSEFVVCIRDWGTAFDPTAVPAPDLSAHVREGRRHGLGIFLIRQIMDEAVYTSDADGRNELRLVRRVRRAEVSVDRAAPGLPEGQAPDRSAGEGAPKGALSPTEREERPAGESEKTEKIEKIEKTKKTKKAKKAKKAKAKKAKAKKVKRARKAK